ncbi:MAG: hypothetical protein R3B72_26730 [Polyangiaceae bacterium]
MSDDFAKPESLWAILARDHLLTACFFLLLAVGLAPLLATPVLPFIDMNVTIAHGSILFDVMGHKEPFGSAFEINPLPVPYWTIYILSGVLDAIGGALFAARAVVALAIFVLPLSVMRLLVALRRDPRLGLWAFMFNWERNLWAGWVAYILGIALALWTIAWLLEVESLSDAVKTTVLTALVAITHAQALAFLAVAGLLLFFTRARTLKETGLYVLSLAGGLIAMRPWLEDVFADVHTTSGLKQSFELQEHTVSDKLAKLYAHTFDVFAGDYETWTTGFMFLLLFAGPIAIAAATRSRRGAPLAPPIAITLAALALYVVLPFALKGPGGVFHKHNYVRYAMVMLIGLLTIPRPWLRGKAALWLVPGLVLALAMDVQMYRHLRHFSRRMVALQSLASQIPPRSYVLPIVGERNDPTCRMAPLSGVASLMIASRKSYTPQLWSIRHVPILFTPKAPPRARGSKVTKGLLRRYDYVLVQGLGHDPFPRSKDKLPVELLGEADIWRLYRVDREAAAR